MTAHQPTGQFCYQHLFHFQGVIILRSRVLVHDMETHIFPARLQCPDNAHTVLRIPKLHAFSTPAFMHTQACQHTIPVVKSISKSFSNLVIYQRFS